MMPQERLAKAEELRIERAKEEKKTPSLSLALLLEPFRRSGARRDSPSLSSAGFLRSLARPLGKQGRERIRRERASLKLSLERKPSPPPERCILSFFPSYLLPTAMAPPDLDEWIERLRKCEHLEEDELKTLCEMVRMTVFFFLILFPPS